MASNTEEVLRGRRIDHSWWKKLLDFEEAEKQIWFSVPMIITNVCYYFIPLVSVMFVGHLGKLELAASNLAHTWANVTGFAFMLGLSGSLETLCGQSYGAQLYTKMGIYLQASCIISIVFSIIISIIWIFTEPILILLHQDPHISKKAATYIWFLIPGMFAYGLLQNILRFLQTQSIVMPLAVCSVLPLLVHIGIAYVFVHITKLGFVGAAVASSFSLWISVIMLASFVLYSEKFNETWKGFSFDSFRHVLSTFKLALPSAAMVCLEFWAFEILVLLAGAMKNAEITTPLIAMCINTEAIAYMFTYGLSSAVSTRVSNELGAGNAAAAKGSMVVTLELSILLGMVFVLGLLFGHRGWARLFSDSHVIIDKFASMTPFLMSSIVVDSIQGVFSGVARGCGWQQWAVCINLAMFYLIGIPIAVVLAFKFEMNVKGLWIGLICGLVCQSGSLLLLTQFKKWTRMKLSQDQGQVQPAAI